MRTIAYLFAVLLVLRLNISTLAQPPSWRWAAYGSNTVNAITNKVVTDASGNLCTAGSFAGTIRIGDSVYVSRGKEDVVISNYDYAGRLRWSRRLGDTGKTICTAICTDKKTGDIYVAGTFQFHIRIGDTMFPGKVIHSVFANDIFLVKYNATGKLIWSYCSGTYYDDQIANMDIDSRHNLVLGGSFVMTGASPPVIDTIAFGAIRLICKGNQDVFVAKCDSNGTFIWAKNPGDKQSEQCFDIHLDSQDNIFLCGAYSRVFQLDGIMLRSIDKGLFGGDEFIAKLDPTGQAIWAQRVGGIGPSSGSDWEGMYASYCAVDPDGNAYIGGNYTGGTLIFDSLDRSNALPGGGQWLAKYGAADGTVLWTKRVGGGGFTRALCTDRAGNSYLTGSCAQGVVYGGETVPRDMPNDFEKLLVLSYDPQGRQRWMRTAGDLCGAVGHGIAADAPDDVVVSGTFGGGASIQFGNTTCYNTGTQGNGFVARLRPDAAGVPNTSAAEVQIYPNPARTELHIVQASAAYDRYRLINALGQRVADGALHSTEQTIRLPQLAAGVYYLELSGDHPAARMPVTIQP